jgi:hypothetical protein
MAEATALKLAIDLLHVPSRVRPLRSAALPTDVLTLLEIAAGDADAAQRASEASGRTMAVVRNAAAFFIEQILLAPGADSYRVLGGNAQTSSTELRRNMALLLRWLHPDLDPRGERSLFARRVTRAWNDLKTEERRAAYDQAARLNAQAARRKKKEHAARSSRGKQAPQPGGNGASYRSANRAAQLAGDPPSGIIGRVLLSLLNRFAH